MPLIYFNSQSSLQVIAFPGHVLNIKTSPAYFRKQIVSLAVLWVLQKDFKVQDSQKFENLCLWFIFTVSRSFMLFVFWKVVSVRKRRPLFLKKSVSRYHFCVSQNSSWKSEMATLSSTRLPRVKSENIPAWTLLIFGKIWTFWVFGTLKPAPTLPILTSDA